MKDVLTLAPTLRLEAPTLTLKAPTILLDASKFNRLFKLLFANLHSV